MGTNYVDNAKLHDLLLLAQKEGKASEELVLMAGLIGVNLRKRYRYDYVSQDDAEYIGWIVALTKYKHYNSNKGSAFGFMTTVILNEMRQTWRKEHNYQVTLLKIMNEG